MEAGRLDRKISIEANTPTRDSVGQPIASWSRIGQTRWASRGAVSGAERFISDQFIAREQIEFQVRWTDDLASIGPLNRIVYPASTTPANSEIYDIIAVHEIGRQEGLRIITARRTE